MNTWTSVIVLVFSATLVNCAPTDMFQNGTATKNATMFDVIIKKCPQLDKLELLDNLNDIFTKQCVNWTEIDTTQSLSNPSIDQCLLLYESMTYFCGKLDQDKYLGLVPSSKTISIVSTYDISSICMSDSSFKSQLLNKTEHNISKILEPMYCVLTCGRLNSNEATSYNICKYAYYFASFDVKKFITNAKNLTGHSSNSVPVIDVSNSIKKDENTSLDTPDGIDQNKLLTGYSGNINSLRSSVINNMDQKPTDIITDKEKLPTMTQQGSKKSIPEQSREPIQPFKNQEITHPESHSKVKIEQHTQEQTVIPQVEIETKNKTPEAEEHNPHTGDPNPMPVPNIKVDDDASRKNNAADLNDVKDQDDGLGDDDGFAEQEEDQPEQDNAGKAGKADRVLVGETSETILKEVKPNTVEEESVDPYNSDDMEGDSNFFSYFSLLMCLCVGGYVGYHNRQKILALILEGKRSKKTGRARRPNSANYHKLDSNLEEAMSSSSCTKNASNIIY